MLRRTILTVVITMLSITCVIGRNKIEPTILQKADKEKMNQWVDSVFNTMSLDEKIGQMITIMASGDNTEVNRRNLSKLIRNQKIGGVLFSKGTAPNQLDLTNMCQSEAKVPLLISLDGEWGLSMRLTNTTRFPKNMMLGAIKDDSLIYYYGREVARQCRLMGIHVNFAPSVDVNSNSSNPVIGMRSFGENPDRVASLAIAYSKGLEDGGVMAVAKHFPGHGDTSTDSHKVLPLIPHNKKRLEEVEFFPFQKFIEKGFSGMMIGHLDIPVLDKSGTPSSLSKPIVTDLLQTNFGFSGLIFTDGLAMKGVSREPNMSVKAILAGNDILLGPIYPEKEFEALRNAVKKGTIPTSLVDERCRKILMYKYLFGVNKSDTPNVKDIEKRLNTSYAEWLARKLNEKAMTLLKNEHDFLPINKLDKRKIVAISIGEDSNNLFHKTLKSYGNVTCISLKDSDELVRFKRNLSDFNTVIVSIHSNKVYSEAMIRSIIGDRDNMIVFFTSPYKISSYSSVVKKADGILLAYENTPFSQEYAAQAVFGGIKTEGQLPVSIKGLYQLGKGDTTSKTRLAYGMPEDVGILSYKFDKISDIVEDAISQEAFPGCQILVAKDGVVIYNRSFGTFEYNKLRPVNNDDIYDLASMTKASATVPAIMKLYDEKKISLQNPISKFVSSLRKTYKSSITIKEALLHESGLVSFVPYYMPAIDKSSYSGKLFSSQPTSLYTAQFDDNTWGRTDYKFRSDLISSTPKSGYELKIAEGMYANPAYKDTIIQAIVDSKLRSKKNYLYSCLNFILLKEVVESISQMDLNSFLQQNYYQKLGATTTTYNPLDKFGKDVIAPTENDQFLRKQLLQGYVHDEGAAFLGGISGNAGLFSSANDLAKLYQMWLNEGKYGGEEYLNKSTVQMFTVTKSASSRRGLGFDKPDPRNNRQSPTSPHTPVSTYGHTGFTGTAFWIDPDNKLIYIFLSNRVNDSRTHKKLMTLNVRSRIQEVIYDAIR